MKTILQPSRFQRTAFCAAVVFGFLVATFNIFADALATIHVSAQPLHGGRVDPKLFGNFMELLEDVVPGMWAEMLNDRAFEGITPGVDWAYYDGSATICDRAWETNATGRYETKDAFKGVRCAELTAKNAHAATIAQSGLAVKKDMTYQMSGYFRADNPKLKVTISLRSRLPDGSWFTLASAKFSQIGATWEGKLLTLKSCGDSDRAVFEIRAEGEGHLWIDTLSLMPANNLGGWRADVVQAIREAKPALIRWGGSVADPGRYHWKEGIGNRDLRTPFLNEVWGRIDSNDVGIDEFCQFCELAGAEPLICVSFADGAQSAADLVQYCNGSTKTKWGAKRAANGHLAPYHVKFWQIGNEISGDNPDYLARIPEFIGAIHKASPTVEILSSFPSKKLLERAGSDLKFVAPHHYTTDFVACERELTELTTLFESTPAWDDVQIAITEWNTSAGDWGVGRAKQMTLGAALQNARYLNVLIRHSDKVKIACRSNLANSFCGGLIETSPAGVLKRPAYYTMQLYATHALPMPLQASTSRNDLDVCACASERRESLVIFAVNSKAEPVRCSLTFEQFAMPVQTVSMTTVTDQQSARQPDVMNHWNAPDRVCAKTTPLMGNEVTLPALSVSAIECR
jgi:alpha-L-arabinofuranosidase